MGCRAPGAQLTHPNSFIAIIIAFLSLLLSPAFSILLAWSHSSQRGYLMTSQSLVIVAHTHTHTHAHRGGTLGLPSSFLPLLLWLFFFSLKSGDKDFTLETGGSC